jgi:exonuclease SbcD
VEFHTPEAEIKGPTPVDTENLDWVEAYAEYRRTTTAKEASPELLEAFKQVYEEAHTPSNQPAH